MNKIEVKEKLKNAEKINFVIEIGKTFNELFDCMAISLAFKELQKARATYKDMSTYRDGIGIVKEEIEELQKQIQLAKGWRKDGEDDFNEEKVKTEAVKVVAMSIRFLSDLIIKSEEMKKKDKAEKNG